MSAAMVLITYTPGPAAKPQDYEPWLRSEDNPLFNSIGGIDQYSNWKVLSPADLGWTHFDFLGLRTAQDLERVWFSPELDRFRKKWVERWGYVGAVPSPKSGYATLFMREGAPVRAEQRYVELDFGSAKGWTAVASLRKHWALGPAPAGEPWRRPIAEFNPLGVSSLALTFHAQRPRSTNHVLAECIAAPEESP